MIDPAAPVPEVKPTQEAVVHAAVAEAVAGPGVLPAVPPPALREDRLRVFIIGTASRGIFGRGIRLLTGYPVSHTLLLFRAQGSFYEEPWAVAEATDQGFFPKLVRRAETPTWQSAYEILLPYQGLRKVVNGMLKISGTRYDWSTIRGWILPSLLNRITGHRGLRRPKARGDGKVYCSEAASGLLQRAGVTGLRAAEISPGELDEDLAKSPEARPIAIADLLALIGPERTE